MSNFEEKLDIQLDVHFTDYMWPSPTGDIAAFELFKSEILQAHREAVAEAERGTLVCGFCKDESVAVQAGFSVCWEHFEKYTYRTIEYSELTPTAGGE